MVVVVPPRKGLAWLATTHKDKRRFGTNDQISIKGGMMEITSHSLIHAQREFCVQFQFDRTDPRPPLSKKSTRDAFPGC